MIGNIETYSVTIRGTRPLLHNRFVHDDSKKRRTTYIPEDEAKKALYLKNDIPIQPATHLEGCMIKAATQFKLKGRKTYKDVFKASVFVDPQEIPFEIPEDGNYEIDERAVVIQRSRVLCWRPRWDDWQFTFKVQVMQPDYLTGEQLKEIITYGGNFVGIGDFRPKFGTFKVTSFEKISGE